MNIPRPIIYNEESVKFLDQRALPQQEIYLDISSLEDSFEAIKNMVVRGAPLIGFSALWGMVIWLKKNPKATGEDYEQACDRLKLARPTAVNLAYELDCSKELLKPFFLEGASFETLLKVLREFVILRMQELERHNMSTAQMAYDELVKVTGKTTGFRLMTLCNTGYLACGPLGTALGVISHLHSQGKMEHAFACETRPYLQGARLTAFELDCLGVPHHLIVEGAISHVLKHERIDAIFVGADRIAANGDTANKVGTSTLAICAKHYGIPFYVVAPTSSFDLSLGDGSGIHIEMRPEEEITHWKGERVTAMGTHAYNPSFDITSVEHIHGIFCEKGFIQVMNNQAQNLTQIVRG